MKQNPYKYDGPLDPTKDRLVYIPRKDDVRKLIEGIQRGEFWTVLGPRQIGKTTFLRQIVQEFKGAHHIYINFEVSHSDEESFYEWLTEQFIEQIPAQSLDVSTAKRQEYSALRFLDFLEEFKPKDNKKVVLMFDEIDGLPFLSDFLHVWRKVFIDRYNKEGLKKYGVIVTGSVNLIKQTIGANSPFNIARKIYLRDFTDEESEILITEPFKELSIHIELEAKKTLKSLVSGHPQMLQEACYILVERAGKPGKTITGQDVDEAVEQLLLTNASLDTLKADLEKNAKLENLLRDILSGTERKYLPNKDFSILGAGAIIEENPYCKIRNRIYEIYLKEIFEIDETAIFEETLLQDSQKSETDGSQGKNKIAFAGVFLFLAVFTAFISFLAKSDVGMALALTFTIITVLCWKLMK